MGWGNCGMYPSNAYGNRSGFHRSTRRVDFCFMDTVAGALLLDSLYRDRIPHVPTAKCTVIAQLSTAMSMLLSAWIFPFIEFRGRFCHVKSTYISPATREVMGGKRSRIRGDCRLKGRTECEVPVELMIFPVGLPEWIFCFFLRRKSSK
jgi:hypothetical protein